MNRIRKLHEVYQVLITPNIKISPDSSLMLGNWEDEELRNFFILEFQTLRDAQCEALKHPDIDWYRIVINHKHIYQRIKIALEQIIYENNFVVEYHPSLMDPEQFKNTMFDRVMQNGERFNLTYGMNDIMNFTIVNPWTNNLHKLAKNIESHREHLYRDDLRIRSKKIIDGTTVILYGVTELGSVYSIKLVSTLLYQWSEWYKSHGNSNNDYGIKLYSNFLKTQEILDKDIVLR